MDVTEKYLRQYPEQICNGVFIAVVSTWFNCRLAGGPVYHQPDMELSANPVRVGFGRCKRSATTCAHTMTTMEGTRAPTRWNG